MIKYVSTRTIPLDQLETFPGNPNIGDVPKILESLRSNGVFRSLIVRQLDDGRHIILAGNHTKLAMVEHGAGQCDYEQSREGEQPVCGLCGSSPWNSRARCEIYECDDQTAVRINLADNRIPEFSHRDDHLLSDLLRTLDDVAGSGYTDDDLSLYLPHDPFPDLQELTEQEDRPEQEEGWPSYTVKVSRGTWTTFLELTEDADDPDDTGSRFTYLLSKVQG